MVLGGEATWWSAAGALPRASYRPSLTIRSAPYIPILHAHRHMYASVAFPPLLLFFALRARLAAVGFLRHMFRHVRLRFHSVARHVSLCYISTEVAGDLIGRHLVSGSASAVWHISESSGPASPLPHLYSQVIVILGPLASCKPRVWGTATAAMFLFFVGQDG